MSLEKSNFSCPLSMASCSRHEAAVRHLPHRCSVQVLQKTGSETLSVFNSANFLKWMRGYVALPAIIMLAEERQQNNQECTKADKRPTGNPGEMLTLEKIAGYCN